MKKLAILLTILFAINSTAHFISSEMKLSVEEPSVIGFGKTIYIDANITFSWGFGAIIPLPLIIFIEVKDCPNWLSVSLSENTITINPFGIFGGEISKNIRISLFAKEEAQAFIPYSFILHVYTNGSFLIRGAEAKEVINVMQDFYDKGLEIEIAQEIRIIEGDTKFVSLNITNNCNSGVYVEVEMENISSFSMQPVKEFISYGKKKSISLYITANGIGEERGILKITYYPAEKPSIKNYINKEIMLKSYSKGGGGGAIAVGIIIIIIGLIIYGIWKKRK